MSEEHQRQCRRLRPCLPRVFGPAHSEAITQALDGGGDAALALIRVGEAFTCDDGDSEPVSNPWPTLTSTRCGAKRREKVRHGLTQRRLSPSHRRTLRSTRWGGHRQRRPDVPCALSRFRLILVLLIIT